MLRYRWSDLLAEAESNADIHGALAKVRAGGTGASAGEECAAAVSGGNVGADHTMEPKRRAGLDGYGETEGAELAVAAKGDADVTAQERVDGDAAHVEGVMNADAQVKTEHAETVHAAAEVQGGVANRSGGVEYGPEVSLDVEFDSVGRRESFGEVSFGSAGIDANGLSPAEAEEEPKLQTQSTGVSQAWSRRYIPLWVLLGRVFATRVMNGDRRVLSLLSGLRLHRLHRLRLDRCRLRCLSSDVDFDVDARLPLHANDGDGIGARTVAHTSGARRARRLTDLSARGLGAQGRRDTESQGGGE